MILEAVYLHIKTGQTAAFESAFQEASTLIRTMPGYVNHELHHALEDDHLYLLLVRWATLEDHTIGFRGSAEYQTWKGLLHHFYDPFPTVWHFSPVAIGN
jgi:heme-degrading monooxygenase HmoA